jgi:dephospho-CoA kinase
MIVIGIVGRIAAGKSSVARLLASRGAEVLDADRIAHEVLEAVDVRREIARQLGDDVLDAEGWVQRSVLAERVFGKTESHDRALEALEDIVHPRVRQQIEARLAVIRSGPGADTAVVVLDVPLLMQAGWDDLCDRLVLVECAEEERQRRMVLRGWSVDQRAARERAWERRYRPPAAEKTTRVDASADAAYTRAQVDDFWKTRLWW